MGADESPVGATPKETPGGSLGNTRKTEKPCKGDPVPAADECPGSGTPRRGLCGRRAAEVRAREIVLRGNEGRNAFAPKCSETPSPEGAGLFSVGFQPYVNGKNAMRAVSARLRERARARKPPADFTDECRRKPRRGDPKRNPGRKPGEYAQNGKAL